MFVLHGIWQRLTRLLLLIPILLFADCRKNPETETATPNDTPKIEIVADSGLELDPTIPRTQADIKHVSVVATTELDAPSIPTTPKSDKKLKDQQNKLITTTKNRLESRFDALPTPLPETNKLPADVATTSNTQSNAQEAVDLMPLCTEVDRGARQIRSFNVDRAFPFVADGTEREGRVSAILRIDERGNVVGTSVVSSNPEGIFESGLNREAALMKFSPARRNCVDVASTYNLTIQFGRE